MKYFKFVCGDKGRLSNDFQTVNNNVRCEAERYCAYLSRMYEYYFRPIQTDGIVALTVCLVENLSECKQPDICVSYITVQNIIDLNKFAGLSCEAKSFYIIELCQDAIIKFVMQRQWDLTPFEATFEKMRNRRGLFREYWKKAITSPNKQIKARIYFEDDYDSNGVYADFVDRKGKLINRVKFAPQGYSIYCQDIGEIQWLDDSHIKIFYLSGCASQYRDYWVIELEGKVEFHYRAEDSDNNSHSLFSLGLLYWNGTKIMQDRDKGLELIRKSAELNYKHAQAWLKNNINED